MDASRTPLCLSLCLSGEESVFSALPPHLRGSAVKTTLSPRSLSTFQWTHAHATLKEMDPLLARGISLFNEGAWFECHEVLEEAWTPERGPRRLFLQGLIHVAVGLYHHSRDNPVGAIRQLRKASRKLGPYAPGWEEVDIECLLRDVDAAVACIESGARLEHYPEIHFVRRRSASR